MFTFGIIHSKDGDMMVVEYKGDDDLLMTMVWMT